MLADVGGEELEAWMLATEVVLPKDRKPEAAVNRARAHEWVSTSGAEPCRAGVGLVWEFARLSICQPA